jgi:hypothetical protein
VPEEPADPSPPITVVVDRVIDLLRQSSRGVIVLAADGLGRPPALAATRHGSVEVLRSTFPSTSVTAWTSALTGVEPGEHGLLGTVFRVPEADLVVDAVEGRVYSWTDAADWRDHTIKPRTLFERAAAEGDGHGDRGGIRTVVVGREFDGVRGAWPQTLFRGATRVHTSQDRLPVAAASVARSVISQVDDLLDRSPAPRLLLWVYVNVDEHIHRNGNDDELLDSVRLLDEAAHGWADAGWIVVLHADHGHTEVVHDPDARRLWASVDSPANCRLPSGGAGRVRWLYPRPDTAEHIAATLRAELGECAMVTTPAELVERGLLSAAAAASRRIGEIVAVATAPSFPIPRPDYRFEHGALTDDEVYIPFISWRR